MTTADLPHPGPGAPQPEGQPQGQGRPNWLKLTALLILLICLGWVALLIFQYCGNGLFPKHLPGLPGLSQVAERASYSDSFPDDSGLGRPLGVAVGSGGDRIYVTESDGERMIRVFNREGREIGALAPPGTDASTRVPLYVAVSPKDEVYVSDRFNHAIYIWAADGSFVGTFEPQSVGAEGWNPMGLAFDPQGNLYVTDLTPGKHRVMVFDSSGALKLQFGKEGTDPGDFSYPSGLAVDDEGRIYVADGNNGRLQVFDAEGRLVNGISRGYAQGDLALPRGVALDGDGHLFVADTAAQSVKVYDISGDAPEFLYALGGEFRYPNGVDVADGMIYVTDRENGRVQIWGR
jgi:DNA-binding beta-propeller fold protein YncE